MRSYQSRVGPNPIRLVSIKKGSLDPDTHREGWSYNAISQGTRKARKKAWNRVFPGVFRGNMALPTP